MLHKKTGKYTSLFYLKNWGGCVQKRIKFFLSHLFVSLLVSLIVVGLILLRWYPSPLAMATGVVHIFLILIVIDVVIGPILGFVVYKEGKRSLKIDLAVIIVIQVSALCYGVYSIAQGRPTWIVYNIDQFELMRNNDLYISEEANIPLKYKNKFWNSPKFVATQFSKNPKFKQAEMNDEIFHGISIAQRPERYVDLNQVKSLIYQHSQNLGVLKQYNDPQQVESVLAKYPIATAFVPLRTNAVDMTVLINKEKGEVVKIVDLRPWK